MPSRLAVHVPMGHDKFTTTMGVICLPSDEGTNDRSYVSYILNSIFKKHTVMNKEQWTSGPLTCWRLKFTLKRHATLQQAVHSLNFSLTTNEIKEMNKLLSVVWLLNLNLLGPWPASGPLVHCSVFITVTLIHC